MNKTENFIKKSIDIHGNLYDYSLVEYINNNTKVKILCNEHGEFKQKPVNHIYFKCGCPKCAGKNITTQEFIEKCNKIHGNLYDYSLVDYKTMHIKIKIICPEHGIFEQTPSNHIHHGCKKCFFDKKRNNEKIIIEKFKKLHNNLYDYSLIDYKTMNTKIKIVCLKHGIFEQTPVNHLQGKGCYKCSPNSKKDIFLILEKLNELHNNKYNYDMNFNKTSNKIEILCDKHGIFYQTLNNHLDGHGCPFCNESSGEKKINQYLSEKNIKFERQKTFSSCKDKRKLPFDFYLCDYNLCIEYDGEQHFMIVEEWGGEEKFLIIKKHDEIKNEFCWKNSIKLLRINYEEKIEEKISNFFLDIL